MTTGHVLLGLLSRGQQHGYDLKRAYDATFPSARPLAFGQVYAALSRLEAKGWVAVSGVERGGGPERTVYERTEEGAMEYRTWLADGEDPGGTVANPVGTKVTLALMSDGVAAAVDVIDHQRALHLARLREHTARKRSGELTLSETLAADLAIAHLDADVRWMERAEQRMAELKEELP